MWRATLAVGNEQSDLIERRMSLQINGAILPAGLISGAKTYSVILDDATVYLIHVGPAASNVPTYNPFERMLNDYLSGRAAKKIAEGEARLAELGEATLAQEKHSTMLTAADIQKIALKERGNSLLLTIRSRNGNYKLIFKRNVLSQLEEIVTILRES
jgi:hypothetical protein